jgi:hypothetical protein
MNQITDRTRSQQFAFGKLTDTMYDVTLEQFQATADKICAVRDERRFVFQIYFDGAWHTHSEITSEMVQSC